MDDFIVVSECTDCAKIISCNDTRNLADDDANVYNHHRIWLNHDYQLNRAVCIGYRKFFNCTTQTGRC